MTVRNLNWQLETTFTRKQIIAMAKLSEYVGNIQNDLTKEFPSTFNGDFDWESVREVMTLFSRLGKEDSLAYRALCQAVHDVNAGKVQLLSGKIVPVEKEEQ